MEAIIYKKSLNLELILWRANDVPQEYVDAHNTHIAKFYSGSGQRKFDRESICREIKKGKKNNNCFYYGVYDKDCDELIGTIIIQDINYNNKTADVVPFISNSKYFKYKLGSDAIKLGCKKAFEDHGICKIFGGINKDNVGAVKTFLKSGYVVEGIRFGHFGGNEGRSDEILVACFNKEYFSKKMKYDRNISAF